MLQAMKEDPPADYKCKDKFLVQCIKVPYDVLHLEGDELNTRLTELWQQAEALKKEDPSTVSEILEERKLKCVFGASEGSLMSPIREESAHSLLPPVTLASDTITVDTQVPTNFTELAGGTNGSATVTSAESNFPPESVARKPSESYHFTSAENIPSVPVPQPEIAAPKPDIANILQATSPAPIPEPVVITKKVQPEAAERSPKRSTLSSEIAKEKKPVALESPKEKKVPVVAESKRSTPTSGASILSKPIVATEPIPMQSVQGKELQEAKEIIRKLTLACENYKAEIEQLNALRIRKAATSPVEVKNMTVKEPDNRLPVQVVAVIAFIAFIFGAIFFWSVHLIQFITRIG